MTDALQDAVGGLISLCLGLCLIFWLIPGWVEADRDLRLPTSLVPQVVAIGLAGAGSIMLLRGGLALRRGAPASDSPFAPGEFGTVCLMILILIGATLAFQLLHFLIVAPVLVAISMWIFGPLRPVSFVLTSALGPLAIWILGTEVLGSVLP